MASTSLDVFLGGALVGTLARTRRGARFSYTPEMAERSLGMPILSLSLPVKRRAYAEGLTGSWFGGLLPEGARLERACRELHCPEYDYMGILEHIGWECA